MSIPAADLAAQFAAQRLASHALSLAFDAALNRTVLSRFMYLLTSEEEVDDVRRFELLLYQRSAQEIDVALLRAVADVMEALEDERCDEREISRASQLNMTAS
jgi:hypothetical protein